MYNVEKVSEPRWPAGLVAVGIPLFVFGLDGTWDGPAYTARAVLTAGVQSIWLVLGCLVGWTLGRRAMRRGRYLSTGAGIGFGLAVILPLPFLRLLGFTLLPEAERARVLLELPGWLPPVLLAVGVLAMGSGVWRVRQARRSYLVGG